MQTYIVYTGNSMRDEASSLSLYKNMLQEVAERLLNSIKILVNNFALW